MKDDLECPYRDIKLRIYYITDKSIFKVFKKFFWKPSTEIEGTPININKSENSYRNLRTDSLLSLHSKYGQHSSIAEWKWLFIGSTEPTKLLPVTWNM